MSSGSTKIQLQFLFKTSGMVRRYGRLKIGGIHHVNGNYQFIVQILNAAWHFVLIQPNVMNWKIIGTQKQSAMNFVVGIVEGIL